MKKKIKIDDLVPFIKKGWICCDAQGFWRWYRTKPFVVKSPIIKGWCNYDWGIIEIFGRMFDIEPFNGDWKKSLRRIK